MKRIFVFFLMIMMFTTTVDSSAIQAKSKCTYYFAYLNLLEGYEAVYSYENEGIGAIYDVHVKKNKIVITGSLNKSSKSLEIYNENNTFLSGSTRAFKLTKKTKYYQSGESGQERIPKSIFKSSMIQGNKGLLSFAVQIKVKHGKVVRIDLLV